MYIYPDNAALQYSGRIDFDCPAEPVFVYAASYVKLIFTGNLCESENFEPKKLLDQLYWIYFGW
mgnify:CR=1 FL=1